LSKYSLILSNIVDANTKMKVLDLQVDGKRLLEDFEQEIEKNGKLNVYASALKIIEHSANGFRLPKTKFRPIQDTGLKCKFYEAKKDDVRVYLFQDPQGRVIVCGGLKGNQKKDLKKYIAIVKDYLKHKP